MRQFPSMHGCPFVSGAMHAHHVLPCSLMHQLADFKAKRAALKTAIASGAPAVNARTSQGGGVGSCGMITCGTQHHPWVLSLCSDLGGRPLLLLRLTAGAQPMAAHHLPLNRRWMALMGMPTCWSQHPATSNSSCSICSISLTLLIIISSGSLTWLICGNSTLLGQMGYQLRTLARTQCLRRQWTQHCSQMAD